MSRFASRDDARVPRRHRADAIDRAAGRGSPRQPRPPSRRASLDRASDAPNCYQLLDVPLTATTKQIKKAYRRRALDVHPDKCGANCGEEANKRFVDLAFAYETLGDESTRGGTNAAAGNGRRAPRRRRRVLVLVQHLRVALRRVGAIAVRPRQGSAADGAGMGHPILRRRGGRPGRQVPSRGGDQGQAAPEERRRRRDGRARRSIRRAREGRGRATTRARAR